MKFLLSAAAVLAMAAHQPSEALTSEQRAQAVLAQAKVAAGGAKLDRVTTFYSGGTRLRDGKIDGVYQEWGDYRTMAFTNVETFDGVPSTGGYDGKTAWGLGADGKVILTGPRQASGAKLSGHLDVQGYLFPERFPAKATHTGVQRANGRPCDVIEVTPEGVPTITLWFDQQTHLLSRLTGRLGRNEIQGDVSGYRTVDGLPLFSRGLQTMTTPSGVHTETQNVVVFKIEPIPPERLAIPK